MMTVGMLMRLGLAALVAGVTSGALLVLAVYFGGAGIGHPEIPWMSAMLFDWLETGLVAGLAVASIPAFVAGAAMWGLGRRIAAARRFPAWAAAGAAVGGALFALFGLVLGKMGRGGLDSFETVLLCASLIAGAGGALAFLLAIRLSGPARRRPSDRKRERPL